MQGPQGTQGNQGAPGAQGNQGTQGTQGLQSTWAVQGTQHAISTAFANVTGLQVNSLTPSATYEVEAIIGCQSSATTGLQFALQCSTASATVAASLIGTQTAAVTRNERISAQGAQGPAVMLVAGTGVVQIKGIVITAAGGSPSIGIQAKKVTSGTGAVFAQSYFKVTRIA